MMASGIPETKTGGNTCLNIEVCLNTNCYWEIAVGILLVEFDITYVTQKSMKGQAIADHLAENSIEGYKPMTDLFLGVSILNIKPEEEHSNWLMYLMWQ